ncbi:TPA: fimbrial protein [Enterobacter hormaechei subsp. steigerwaltii]|nr:fimbrial protein [Enterobacter hormaechei subsp. steigerwaltii]
MFKARIELTVNDDYHGNPTKETTIHPKAGTLGSMSLGDHTASNNKPWKFIVNEASFQIPVILPTCDVMMLSNGSNTVDMGDYYISDIKNNKVRDIPFAINVSNCTSVAKFTTKMTSTKLTGSENLLGNTLTSNAASGMGVKIFHDGDQQLIPNNDNSTYVYNDNSIPGSTNINLTARLVADGNAFKAGQFKATSVFSMTYD